MIIIRILLTPFRIIVFLWYGFRNLFPSTGRLFHYLPDRFSLIRPGGFFSHFGPAADANYFDHLIFLRILARSNSLKHALFIIPEMHAPWSEVEEIGNRISDIIKAGKKVIAFSDGGNLKTLYLMSAATKRYCSPYATFTAGLPAAEPFFIKETLKKAGIEVESFFAGKFKSAHEMFTRKSLSPAARTALVTLLKDIGASITNQFKNTPGMKIPEIEKFLEMIRKKIICESSGLLASGFIQKEMPLTECKRFVSSDKKGRKRKTRDKKKGAPPKETPSSKTFTSAEAFVARYNRKMFPLFRLRSKPAIACLVMNGNILMGRSADPVRPESVNALAYRDIIDNLVESPEEAVFLIINSPGGSPTGSEILYQSISLLAQKKPVYALLGSVAASGGYYIASAANHIYCADKTITGSIGVFNIHPSFAGLYKKFGINRERVGFSETQDLFSESKPLSNASRKLIQRLVDALYEQFLDRVASGRGRKKKELYALAAGRVWTGDRFIEKKMIDGRIDFLAALEEYRKEAGYPERVPFKINYYPAIKTDMRMLLNMIPGRFRSHLEYPGVPAELTPFLKSLENFYELYRDVGQPGLPSALFYLPVEFLLPEIFYPDSK